MAGTALTLTLGKGVEFTRNEAKGSNGGALAILGGSTLIGGTDLEFKDNSALMGGAIALLLGGATDLEVEYFPGT